MTRMAWTAEDRRKYAPAIQEVLRQGMIVRLVRTMDALDPQPKVGRERVWSTLIVLQALWHLARAGGAWRRRPAGFPPFTTVWSRLRRWRELAVLDRALAILVACLRLARGRKRRPTAAIIDTQSVKTGPQRGPRGYDAGKKVKGRKRVLLVDTEGDPLGIRVVPADVHEHRALRALAPDLAAHPTLRLAWLDRGFAGEEPEAFLDRHGIAVEVVGIKDRRGFRLEKRRWKAEQTFGCLQRYRRLRVDDEASCETSRGMAADSRAKRNGSSEADPHVFAKLGEQGLERGEEAEALPRREIVAEDDLLQLGVAQGVQVEVAGQVAAQPPVRVLDRPLLPGGVRVAGPGRHGAGARQQAVPGEGGVVVEGDGRAQARVEPAEHRHQHRHGLRRGLAGQPGREHEPRLALLEHQHRPGPLADQQVALPVPGVLPLLDVRGPVVDRAPPGDGAARRPGPPSPPLGAAARQQPPQLLALLPGAVDEGIDRLDRHPP